MVRVVGEAEREVVPDEAVVRVEISTPTLPTPAAALEEGSARRARVRDALAVGAPGARVADARVTTVAIHADREQRDERGEVTRRSVVVGHRGACRLEVIAPADEVATILGVAGSHPDVEQMDPGFRISRPRGRALRRELEAEAVRDALARAASLATAAGLRAGAVVAIGDPPSGAAAPGFPPEPRMMVAAMGIGDALGEVVPVAQRVSAEVPVTLELLPPA